VRLHPAVGEFIRPIRHNLIRPKGQRGRRWSTQGTPNLVAVRLALAVYV
jgi:hypothetical protein